jgi:hypothetical protein
MISVNHGTIHRSIPDAEAKIKAGDIFKADEVFLTNSLLGIMPVSSCNKRKIKYIGTSLQKKVLYLVLLAYPLSIKSGFESPIPSQKCLMESVVAAVLK